MRLVDADALDTALWAHYDKGRGMTRYECAGILDAAPTVACERCEHHKPKFNDVSYPWCSPVGYHHQDFGCVYFQPADPGGTG